MALPVQVRRQSEAVQKLYDELNTDVTPQEGDAPDLVETEDQAQETNTADSESQQVSQSPADEQQQGSTDGEQETYEQRWRSLQGMYNAEVPRLHAEKRELAGRVTQLEQLITSMSAQPAQQEPPKPQQLITEADVEEWGDSIDVMRKVSREEQTSSQARIDQLEQVIREMQSSVVPQVQQISQKQAATAEQTFWGELQQSVPDWQEVNSNQDFQTWLLAIDPLTGIARQTYLDDAQRNMDSGRVISFFQTWKASTGQPVAQQTNRGASTANELEKQVAPGRSRSAGVPQSEELPTYTSADIKTFFQHVQQGKYKGREKERDRIERDIFAAQREGRINNA